MMLLTPGSQPVDRNTPPTSCTPSQGWTIIWAIKELMIHKLFCTFYSKNFHLFQTYCPVATREQIYDSFSLPSACICHYKSPSTLRDLRVRSQPSTPPSFLPRCQAGTKLDLPKFVNSFSDTNGDGRRQSSSIKRQDLNPEALVYPDDNIRRIPRSVLIYCESCLAFSFLTENMLQMLIEDDFYNLIEMD